MNHHLRTLAAVAVVTLSQLGCSTDDTVNLGETKGSALSDYAAQWKGYVENEVLDPLNAPTDVIRVTINADGGGFVRVGDKPLFPPASNYDVGYPVGATAYPLQAGFQYPLLDTRVEDRRLRFRIDTASPFETWCTHQTPYRDSKDPSYWRCLPGPPLGAPPTCHTGYSEEIDHPVVDCSKSQTCIGTCSCTETGCQAMRDEPSFVFTFDGSLEEAGSRLYGDLRGTTVKLTRQ
jgi:hypothetical protein